MANVVDDRGGATNFAKRGKHHLSIVASPCFPILKLSNVVPPVLHITLGITLKLFNMLCASMIGNAKAKNLVKSKPIFLLPAIKALI